MATSKNFIVKNGLDVAGTITSKNITVLSQIDTNGYGYSWNESDDSYVVHTPRYTSYGISWNESTDSYTNNITN